MILVQVVGIWLAVVAVTVGTDVGTAYLAEEKAKKSKLKPEKKTPVVGPINAKVAPGIRTELNLKKIELGLVRIQKRAANPSRLSGMHRRAEAS